MDCVICKKPIEPDEPSRPAGILAQRDESPDDRVHVKCAGFCTRGLGGQIEDLAINAFGSFLSMFR